jgi:hypothetical protein
MIKGIDDIQSIREKVRFGSKSRKFIRDISEDMYSKRKALETIQSSLEILQSIGIFD